MDRFKLVSALTQLDRKESTRKGHNPYALGHYLGAAKQCIEYVTEGMTPEKAFSRAFNPTRGMHGVAKQLGLNLDVQRGQWVILGEWKTA
jgi:hypothetical protein